jgi:hypothetical protein
MANSPWWLNPRNLTAEAIYPNLPTATDEKIQTAREKRRLETFHQRRGYVSPLSGQAVQTNQKGKRK